MKQIIALALLLIMLTACNRPFVETQVTHPSGLRIIKNTLQTQVSPPVTAAQSMEEVSIEHAQIIYYEITYYEITGSTAKELRASMDEVGPRDSSDGNKPVDAFMDWYISWNWPGYGTDKCDLSAASVTYSIKVMMPHWEVPADAPSELASQWSKYMQALALHEQGHVNIIVNNYLSVKTAIQGATCLTAEAAAQKVLDSLRELNSSYDSETKHGETQGAVFP